MSGQLQLILGPVFSGKTTELLRRVERYELSGYACVVICSLKDNNKRTLEDRFKGQVIYVHTIQEAMGAAWQADVIAVDNGHLFEDIGIVDRYASCKVMVVATLDGNCHRERYASIAELIPYCEFVSKLKAICINCGTDAAYTREIIEETGSTVERKKYVATCRLCYFELPKTCSDVSLLGQQKKPRNIILDGHIEAIFGPMFSGKTTEMLRRHNRHQLASRKCKVVKYAGDTRYDNQKVTTHDLLMQDAISTRDIADIYDELVQYDVILIDEAQFFPNAAFYCEKLANEGKVVIVASLDGDYNRKEFKNRILDLCALSEIVVKLKAVCVNCGRDAAFTQRVTSETEQEVIGGKDKYQAVCRACHRSTSKLRPPASLPAVRSPLRVSNHDFPHVDESFQRSNDPML